MPPVPVVGAPLYTPRQLIQIAELEEIRRLTSPPLYGAGINVAVIDTGIRETHEQIMGRVVYSKNFTSDSMRDGFDHGTGVAAIVLDMAPLCNILDLKVLDDRGQGTEEEVILAVDHCVELHGTNPEIAPSMINISLGAPDSGDPDEPLRVAVRAAIERGIWVACAAGNNGPAEGTIMSPATERYARAVGSVNVDTFAVSNFSSRGPSKEGLIKPDVVMFGENIVTASSSTDIATVAKSGTSFATPFITGLNALLAEGMCRPVIVSPELQESYPTITDALKEWMDPADFEPLLPYLTVKPGNIPYQKDNDYGYGLPLGSLIARAFGAKQAMDFSSVTGMVVPLMSIGMMGMMMGGMAKALR